MNQKVCPNRVYISKENLAVPLLCASPSFFLILGSHVCSRCFPNLDQNGYSCHSLTHQSLLQSRLWNRVQHYTGWCLTGLVVFDPHFLICVDIFEGGLVVVTFISAGLGLQHRHRILNTFEGEILTLQCNTLSESAYCFQVNLGRGWLDDLEILQSLSI